MYKTDREGVIEQVMQFAKIMRIFSIIGIAFAGIAIFFILLTMLIGSAVELPAFLVGVIGFVALLLVVIGLLLQIYFFKYYGKVLQKVETKTYCSNKPALLHLVLSILSILRTLQVFVSGDGFPIIGLAIGLFLVYLTFGIYNGLKTIESNRYFDYDELEPTTFDYTVMPEPVDTNRSQTTANNANHGNDSWVKED